MGSIRSWVKAFNQKELPENYFRVEVFILRYYGIELMEKETLKSRFYAGIVFVLIYLCTFGEALELYVQWGDLDAIVNILCYSCTHILGLIKVTLLFYNRKKFGNMIKILHNKPFVPDINRGGEVEEIYLRKIVKTTETQMIAYSTLLVTALWSGAVSFLNSRLFNEKSEWRYPFVPIMIIDTTNSPYFELAGIYQTFWISFYGLLIVTADIVLTIILAHLSTQFKILNNAFKSIRMRSRKMNVLAGEDSRNEGIILSKILGEYIEHHLRVFELAVQMEELCHLMILAELSGSVLTLCFILYQVSSVPPNSFSFLLYFFYYWIVVFQISLYCYWGNEVTLQAANVAKAVAEADWLEAPKSVRKAIILVTARSQKPLYMTAGKFVNLSIDTLVRIIKGSFSYFMVLRQRGISEE